MAQIVVSNTLLVSANLAEALALVDQRMAGWASNSGAYNALLQQVFSRAGTDPALWQQAAAALQSTLQSVGLAISLELLSDEQWIGINGAYTAQAPGGGERIYLNRAWMQAASSVQIEAVLLEELGHAIDTRLNGNTDSPGDEGELFGRLIRGIPMSERSLQVILGEDDTSVARINGQAVALEQAEAQIDPLSLPGQIFGASVDAQGNLIATFDNLRTFTYTHAKISPDRLVLQLAANLGSQIGGDGGRLSAILSNGGIIQLQGDGDLVFISANNLSSQLIGNLKSFPVNTSSIYDVSEDTTGSLGGRILPTDPFTQYGDIAILERGDRLDIFVSGSSLNAFPFVWRIRFEAGQLVDSRVIAASTGTSAGDVNTGRGVAVNNQGLVLTTLPIPVERGPFGGFIDVPVSFNVDFPEGIGESPQVIFKGQGSPLQASNYVDISSTGMTTDAAGNFYVVTNSVGSAALRSRGASLIVLSSDLSRIVDVQTNGLVTSFVDVAVDSTRGLAYAPSFTPFIGGSNPQQISIYPLLFPVTFFQIAPANIPAIAEGSTGNNDLVFTITRTGDTTRTDFVTLTLTGSGANPADSLDFAGGLSIPLSSVISFSPGELSKSIAVTIQGDTTQERDEAFTLTLSDASNRASITNPVAFGLIVNDDFIGDNNDNILIGSILDDFVDGNGGDDILDGGVGTDTLAGGDGNDIYVIDDSGDLVIETNLSPVTGGIDTVLSSLAAYTLTTNVENLTLTGAAAINGTGNTLNNVMTGNTAANRLTGEAGNDTLNGSVGFDTLTGGDGSDTYIIETSGDLVIETNANSAIGGTDRVVSSLANYTLTANVENLTLGVGGLNGTGNALNNSITGNSAANVLNGGAGADTLTGGDGNDTYTIETVGDLVVETNTVAATGGIDTVLSSLVAYILATNVENLTLTGAEPINGTGNALNNVITGNAASNSLSGGAGNDSLNGGAGIDTLTGGDGNDTYIIEAVGDLVIETNDNAATGGIDTVRSALAAYTLTANIENFTLTGVAAINGTGNALNNVITGNNAANVLNGGAGADTLTGGDGDDAFVIDNSGDLAVESNANSAIGGTDRVVTSLAAYTLTANVENLALAGGGINGTGNALNNVVTGNNAANVLNGAAGADTLIGGDGNDAYVIDNPGDLVFETNANPATGGFDRVVSSLATYTLTANVENLALAGGGINGTGNALNNVVTGNNAANVLNGAAGADTLIGGDGNDAYAVDNAGDVVIETNANPVTGGIDRVVSSLAAYTLTANVENLALAGGGINGTGNALNNIITGNNAANVLNGGAGADTLIGGDGNDAFVIDNSGDLVVESNANAAIGDTDRVVSSLASYTLTDNVETLTLGSGGLNGTGNALNNAINGNSAANVLNGAAGNDTLIGGAANDTLTGGLNADTFRFDSALNATTNRDLITDFSLAQSDRIELENSVFTTLTTTGTLAAAGFTTGASATTASHRILYNTTTGLLAFDSDGTGAATAIAFATLTPGLALTHASFTVT